MKIDSYVNKLTLESAFYKRPGDGPLVFDLHLIADNYATHKHPTVKAWLAKHPRFHMHSTSTSASWLNQFERFFGLIAD